MPPQKDIPVPYSR
uniref:Uncharacterized protein n=1 Tax=Rhizophora mucronata TaxID=61149 RepID=A0A2P2PD50_RHIMU